MWSMKTSKVRGNVEHFLKESIRALIYVYQRVISPVFPSSCIYTPTCSQYALEAIEKYGVAKGVFMSFKRITRCHPFRKGGFDPVE